VKPSAYRFIKLLDSIDRANDDATFKAYADAINRYDSQLSVSGHAQSSEWYADELWNHAVKVCYIATLS
jgi:hypothetical protein